MGFCQLVVEFFTQVVKKLLLCTQDQETVCVAPHDDFYPLRYILFLFFITYLPEPTLQLQQLLEGALNVAKGCNFNFYYCFHFWCMTLYSLKIVLLYDFFICIQW